MQTAALVVPVTCLEFLKDTFLLSGEGPVLTVYSLQPRPKAWSSLSVLHHNRIHGIRPAAQGTQPSGLCSSFYDLAVFGGKAVSLVRFHPELQDENHLELLGSVTELQDWVLDVRWLHEDTQSLLCVAVAHNKVLLLDALTRQALFQSSCSEGCLLYSALLLVNGSWDNTVVVGGTVFNQLVLWRPRGREDSSSSEDRAPVERRLLGHRGVIFSISYLEEDGYLASASDDRSVRVWSVGTLGGPGGKCGDSNPACLMVLYGHQARVFSVHLSLGKVFSAGEDGACLVWDLTRDGKVIRTLKGHRAGGVRALAVSEAGEREKKLVASGGADGGLRLWRLEASAQASEDPVTEKLTDLQFSGDGVPKVVCIAGGDSHTSWSQTGFVVCTDKGNLYQYCDGKWELIWQGTPEFQSYCVMETVVFRVKESAANVELCAVGSLSGSVQLFPTSHPDVGICLPAGSGKIHSLIWRKGTDSLTLLASGAEGLVYRWCVKVEINEKGITDLQVNTIPSFSLPPCAKCWLTAAVQLHTQTQEVLWVCGDRRGSLLLFQESKQERKGMIDEQQPTCKSEINEIGLKVKLLQVDECEKVPGTVLHPISCQFGVHGKQGVTSLCEYQGLLYSTGRDGCVRVLRVHTLENSGGSHYGEVVMNTHLQLKVLRVQRACKGMEWLERVLFLQHEGAEEKCKTKQNILLDVSEDEAAARFSEKQREREGRFVIVGFHAVHFVVWDPVKQERLFSVPCGGGHRSWSLWPNNKGVWPGYAALVFIRQGAVVVSQPPREAPGQAEGVELGSGCVLREGVHGRGIGCVCRLGRIRKSGLVSERQEEQWEIIVTGGEDTSLSVIALNAVSGNMNVLSVITDHISSIRTMTAISRPKTGSECQSESVSALLVSAGGRAQIQCYRLLVAWDRQRGAPSCQVIQVANHRLDAQWERRRNRHKMVKTDPETRYMSITVVEERTDCVLLALSCSDGAVRLFSVNEGKSQMDLLWESFYHQRCVLSVATCSLEDDKGNKYKLLFSAATDGKIAVWHLTEASLSMIDNLSSTTSPPIPCLIIPAHQSGVNSLVVWTEKLGRVDGCLVTVASGGDDGQLTVSTLRLQSAQDGRIEHSSEFTQITNSSTLIETELQERNSFGIRLHCQAHVVLAHAAPLTALEVLSPHLLVSTSSDQRVCLWKVCSTSINHIMALCSHVADAAGLAVWVGGNGVRTGIDSVQDFSSQVGPRSKKGCETTERTAGAETVDPGVPVIETSSEKGEGEEISCSGDSDVSTEGSCDCRKRRGKKTGWVLVCGQGFQLLRVGNVETEDEMWREEGATMKVERLI